MRIDDHDVQAYIALHQELYGEILTESEAYDKASRLLRLGEILLGLDAPGQD